MHDETQPETDKLEWEPPTVTVRDVGSATQNNLGFGGDAVNCAS